MTTTMLTRIAMTAIITITGMARRTPMLPA